MQNHSTTKQRLDARIHSELLPASITLNVNNVPFTLSVLTEESLALELASLDAATGSLATLSPAQRKSWADTLAAMLCYLQEPLAVIEHDADAKLTQIRSSQPSQVEKKSEYFELLVKEKSLHLKRVSYDRSTKIRKPIPMVLTKEIAARLLCDIGSELNDLANQPSSLARKLRRKA